MRILIRLTLVLVLLQLSYNSAYSLKWGHLKHFEKAKSTYISEWILNGLPVKYCIERNGADASDDLLSAYVEEGLRTWLNDDEIKDCGVYNKRGEIIDLSKVRLEKVKPPCDVNAGYLIFSFGNSNGPSKGEYCSVDSGCGASPVISISGYSYKQTISDIQKMSGKIVRDLSGSETASLIDGAYRVVVHELGHAMGLCDQYMDHNCSWFYRTNSFPPGVMMHSPGLKITYDDAMGILTIFDRLIDKERIYFGSDGVKKLISMEEMSFYEDTSDLYIKCKDNTYKELLKKDWSKDDLKFTRRPMDPKKAVWLLARDEGLTKSFEKYFKNNSDVNQKDHKGWTPLMGAAIMGKKDVVEILLSKGAKIDERDKEGRTAFIHAAMFNSTSMIEFLLSKGAKIEDKDNSGMTALMYAGLNGSKEVVELLLSKGAKIDEKDNTGATALMWASSMDKQVVVSFLISKGAKINERDNFGMTPLIYAAMGGSKGSVEILIDKGASMDDKDDASMTAFDWAKMLDKTNVMDFLYRKKAIRCTGKSCI